MNRDPRDLTRAPAIALIVVTSLNMLLSIVWIIAFIVNGKTNLQQHVFKDESEKMGYYVGLLGPFSIAVTSLLVAPLILYGAYKMMKLESYSLTKLAAVLAILPITSFCCLAGLPIGIFAISRLNKPEVRNSFIS